ncbi:MAG: O-antigen ligase family protein [Rickettsiales bacterium]|nr:O-antigen ligase family protein [Rickettsiales bacterium]
MTIASETAKPVSACWMWRAAFIMTVLIPLMLIVSRALADGFTALIGILFLVQCARTRSWAWLDDPFIRLALAIWIWLLFVSGFANSPPASYGVALPWIRYILFAAALRHWVLVDGKHTQRLVALTAGLLVLVMIDSFWQYITDVSITGHLKVEGRRLTGPFDNVKVGIYLAKLLLPVCGVGLYYASQNSSRRQFVLYALLLVAGLLIVLLSGERTAFVSLTGSLLAMGLILAICQPRLRLPVLGSIAAFLALFVVLYHTQPLVHDRLGHMLVIFGDIRASAYGQLFWVAWQLGQEYWMLGAGLKGFRVLCLPFLEQGAILNCNLHPHNPYLEFLSETGVMGMTLFIALVVAILWKAIRSIQRRSDYGILPGLLLFGVCVLEFFPFMPTQSIFSNWPAILLWYGVALAWTIQPRAS